MAIPETSGIYGCETWTLSKEIVLTVKADSHATGRQVFGFNRMIGGRVTGSSFSRTSFLMSTLLSRFGILGPDHVS